MPVLVSGAGDIVLVSDRVVLPRLWVRDVGVARDRDRGRGGRSVRRTARDGSLGLPLPEGLLEAMITNDFEWAANNRKAILTEWQSRYDSKSDPK